MEPISNLTRNSTGGSPPVRWPNPPAPPSYPFKKPFEPDDPSIKLTQGQSSIEQLFYSSGANKYMTLAEFKAYPSEEAAISAVKSRMDMSLLGEETEVRKKRLENFGKNPFTSNSGGSFFGQSSSIGGGSSSVKDWGQPSQQDSNSSMSPSMGPLGNKSMSPSIAAFENKRGNTMSKFGQYSKGF
jgi:hypothetical protein